MLGILTSMDDWLIELPLYFSGGFNL